MLQRKLFKYSRVLHRYSGILFLLYFLVMGLSGVLLNHPKLISRLSVPSILVPQSHQLENGRRMAIRDSISTPGQLFIAGRGGVWQSRDQGLHFEPLGRGFPDSAYNRDTLSLHYDPADRRLFAGTRSGLYSYNFDEATWIPIARESIGRQDIVDLVQVGNRLLAVTRDAVFSAESSSETVQFKEETLHFDQNSRPDKVSLPRFLLKLHDGSLFGLVGRLFADLIGLAMIFMTLSGFYYWISPYREQRNTTAITFRKWCYRQHLNVGLYSILFLVLITLSGILIRPPFINPLNQIKLPEQLLALSRTTNQWRPQIDKAAYQSSTDQLWLATRSGFFKAKADLEATFKQVDIAAPTSAMGTNVFAFMSDQTMLIGSFRGLYLCSLQGNSATPVTAPETGNQRPGRIRATATIFDQQKPTFAVDYRRGLTPLDKGAELRLPKEFTSSPMSLWHFLFDLHNGRIFKQWLKQYTWLYIPIGGSLLLLNLLTGLYDWLWHKQKLPTRKR